MDDTTKYLIHADITAAGIVERSDVVGAVFGQTEGLLGDDLDIRGLQQSSKLGRIDVDVDSENGQSFGRITIASSLDKVETAILAASLETITRVGPCRARVEVSGIEDVRAAKRREVVERAKDLLGSAFDEDVMTSQELLEEVRESVRVEDITTFEGLPAGPRVDSSDAIIVVEGRADVLTLLRYGIKNAVGVQGTNVPEEVAALTQERTVTAFLDGDRGGDLILRELAQVGDIDYVARAPDGRSVEDLSRHEVTRALRKKAPFDATMAEPADDGETETEAATDGSTRPAPPPECDTLPETDADAAPSVGSVSESLTAEESAVDEDAPVGDEPVGVEGASSTAEPVPEDESATEESTATDRSDSLVDHVQTVIEGGAGTVRLLDDEFAVFAEGDADDAFDLVEGAGEAPYAVVLDGVVTQRLLDVAAQRGVPQVVGRDRGQFTKQPTAVRVRTAAELLPDLS